MRHVTGPAPLGGVSFPLPVLADPNGRDRGIGRIVVDGLVRLWRTVQRIQQERSTARALSALSDHSLHDIGVDRGYIPAVAHQAASAHLAVSGLTWASAPVAAASNDNPRHRAA
jgi:uncharacterized protein YjiS (DUF1127 family)